MRRNVEYWIAKDSVSDEGEFELWDGPYMTRREANSEFARHYLDDGDGASFDIVRITSEPLHVVRKRRGGGR